MNNFEIYLTPQVAADVNHLRFCVWKMSGAALVSDVEPRLAGICDVLHSSLDECLVQAAREGDTAVLARCCRIFASIDRIGAAERLVRDRIVAPVVEEILNEKSLESDPLGLKGVLAAVLQVVHDRINVFT